MSPYSMGSMPSPRHNSGKVLRLDVSRSRSYCHCNSSAAVVSSSKAGSTHSTEKREHFCYLSMNFKKEGAESLNLDDFEHENKVSYTNFILYWNIRNELGSNSDIQIDREN